MLKNSLIAVGLVLGLAIPSWGAAKGYAPAKSAAAFKGDAKRTYAKAIDANYGAFRSSYVKLSGLALKEFKSQWKAGDGEYRPRILKLRSSSKLASSTALIRTDTDGGSFVAIVRTDPTGKKASKLIAIGGWSESGKLKWNK